jgi:hypothetical protein
MLRPGLAFAFALLLLSCSSADAVVFCSYGSAGAVVRCADYNVVGDTQGQDVTGLEQGLCTSAGGTVVGSCATTGTLGTCTVEETLDGITITSVAYDYAASGLNAAQAEAQCTSENGGGTSATWSAP